MKNLRKLLKRKKKKKKGDREKRENEKEKEVILLNYKGLTQFVGNVRKQ